MTDKKNDPTKKQRGKEKLARIPVKIDKTTKALKKPAWIRVRLPSGSEISEVKKKLRGKSLYTVCEEASFPNLPECFSHGTATFMIMGDKCTRRCSFCDVAHGRPEPLDKDEPKKVADSVIEMDLKYVVITSVDRDDLKDGGAAHFSECIHEIRKRNKNIKIEILVPDYRGRLEVALAATATDLPDVFNHNIETVPSLYKQARSGADYAWSLNLLKEFKKRHPQILTKSGLMVGLGETLEELFVVLDDMRKHDIDMLTVGQYLQPTPYHMPVARYVTPDEFKQIADYAKKIGFTHVASGPMVRSSYHADRQASGEDVS